MQSRYHRPLQYNAGAANGLTRPFVTYPHRDRYIQQRRVRQVSSHDHYDVFEEVWAMGDNGADPVVMKVARNKAGDYIGTPDEARYLCIARGIDPQLLDATHGVCSIGYSARDGKWYGWSHRALYGFKPGDVVGPGDCHAETIPPGTRAHNPDEAKWFAAEFAKAVS